jgi:hypothetical protein
LSLTKELYVIKLDVQTMVVSDFMERPRRFESGSHALQCAGKHFEEAQGRLRGKVR